MQIYSEWDFNLKLPSAINLLPPIKDFVTDYPVIFLIIQRKYVTQREYNKK